MVFYRITFFYFLCLAQISHASKIYYNFGMQGVFFQDAVDKQRFLALSKKLEKGRLLVGSKVSEITFVDRECVKEKMIYRHPFLVGVKNTCLFDLNSRTVKLVASNREPTDHYSFTFLGETEDEQLYLVNGRVFPDAPAGYVKLKRVLKKTGQGKINLLVTAVPGCSGAMAADQTGGSFYYTKAGFAGANTIYRADLKSLQKRAVNEDQAKFSEIFQRVLGPTEDLAFSFKLHAENGFLYYDNHSPWGEFPNYEVSSSLKLKELKPEKKCRSLGITAGIVYFQCGALIRSFDL